MDRNLLLRILYNSGVSEKYNVFIKDDDNSSKKEIIDFFGDTLNKSFKNGTNGRLSIELTNGILFTIRMSDVTNYSLEFIGNWND